jgi:folate-binding Fe-S cluster repair protein YgfZ
MAETFLNSLDTEKVNKLLNETTINVTYFNNACAEVIKKYSESLDNLMSDLYIECIKDGDATVNTLNRYYLELSNMVYFMIDKLEQLGVYADMAKSASKEVYSKSYLSNQVKESGTGKNKTTVAELQAQAELSSQYESVVASIYDHAYKVVKGKLQSAQDMMNTLRKVLTVKGNEMQLSSFGPQQNRSGFGGNE